MNMKGVVTKKLLNDVIETYITSVNHVKWSDKRYEDPRQMNGLKAAAYDKLIEHLRVIIEGDFEELDSVL